MKQESFEEFINRVSDYQHQDLEKEMRSAKRLAIAAVALNVIALGLQIFRFIMRVTGVWE